MTLIKNEKCSDLSSESAGLFLAMDGSNYCIFETLALMGFLFMVQVFCMCLDFFCWSAVYWTAEVLNWPKAFHLDLKLSIRQESLRSIL